jgi:hypothetical protein
MDDIIEFSRRHLKKDVVRRAADEARLYFAAHPDERIDLESNLTNHSELEGLE